MAADRRFEHVLAAAQEGEEWALADLYRRLQPGVLGYLRARRSREAEDIASESWIAVARGLPSFQGCEDDFRRWVFTIARRRLIDAARAESRRPLLARDAAAADGREAPDAATEALASLATRRALELVAALPPDQAEVVVLRVVAGLSAEDVAAVTGRTSVGVRVLQHRALRRLSSLVAQTLVTLQSRLAM